MSIFRRIMRRFGWEWFDTYHGGHYRRTKR